MASEGGKGKLQFFTAGGESFQTLRRQRQRVINWPGVLAVVVSQQPQVAPACCSASRSRCSPELTQRGEGNRTPPDHVAAHLLSPLVQVKLSALVGHLGSFAVPHREAARANDRAVLHGAAFTHAARQHGAKGFASCCKPSGRRTRRRSPEQVTFLLPLHRSNAVVQRNAPSRSWGLVVGASAGAHTACPYQAWPCLCILPGTLHHHRAFIRHPPSMLAANDVSTPQAPGSRGPSIGPIFSEGEIIDGVTCRF